MSQSFPVTVAVHRPDGSVEQVRVGTATKTDQGFSLQLGELSIGAEPAPTRRAAPAAPARSAGPGELPTIFPNYGRAKGLPIAGASANDLDFYANGARRTLGDPSKARFHDKEKLLLQAIQTEQARQGGGGDAPPMPDSGPEAESDDDAY